MPGIEGTGLGQPGAGLSIITHSALLSAPSPGGGSSLRAPRHSHQPPATAIWRGVRGASDAQTARQALGQGGLQGRVSASLAPSSTPWALPGSQKHATRPTCTLLRAAKGRADGITPVVGPRPSLTLLCLRRATATAPQSCPQFLRPVSRMGKKGPQGLSHPYRVSHSTHLHYVIRMAW